jgi:sortase B
MHSVADYNTYENAKTTVASRVVVTLLVLIFVACMAAAVYIAHTYQQGDAEYESLADQYFELPDEDAYSTNTEIQGFNIDWDALRAINPDIVGWVYVPSTSINYPIVWREGDDEYYLKHTFTGDAEYNFGATYGCIMLSGVNAGDFSDDLNIVYGHHMANGSMFAGLAQLYQNSVLFNETRRFYVLTPTKNYRLKSLSIEKVSEDDTSIVIPNFDSYEDMQEYISKRLIRSSVNLIETKVKTENWNKLIAFSTCSEPDNENRLITFCYVEYEYDVVQGDDDGEGGDGEGGEGGEGGTDGEGADGASADAQGGEGVTGEGAAAVPSASTDVLSTPEQVAAQAQALESTE